MRDGHQSILCHCFSTLMTELYSEIDNCAGNETGLTKTQQYSDMTSLLWSQLQNSATQLSIEVTLHVCVCTCLYWVQAGRRDVTYSQCGFTEQGWQTHKVLPRTAIPLHTPRLLSPKRIVLLCHYGNKWLQVLSCIDRWKIAVDHTSYPDKDPLVVFFLAYSDVFHYWNGERPKNSLVHKENANKSQ